MALRHRLVPSALNIRYALQIDIVGSSYPFGAAFT